MDFLKPNNSVSLNKSHLKILVDQVEFVDHPASILLKYTLFYVLYMALEIFSSVKEIMLR